MPAHFRPKENRSLVEKITAPKRLRLLAVGILGIWAFSYIGYHISNKNLVSGPGVIMGGDFITFYAAGKIIQEGKGSRIYDPGFQKQVQDEILAPEKTEGLLYYINPPSVAVWYRVLSFFPYRAAVHLHTLIMGLFFILGLFVLKPHLKGFSSDWWAAGLLGMVWLPMAHTIIGGQNAALAFFLLSWGYIATVKNQQGMAGLALGLLLFKPQFAVPLLGLLLLQKKWRTVGVAFLIGAGHYCIGALYSGWDWPLKMLDSIGGLYRAQERIAGGTTHISILEVIDFSVIQPLEKIKADGSLIKIISGLGYGVVGGLVLFLISVWRKAAPGADDFRLFWALATAGTLLISLHTQYYDLALLVLPVLLILDYQLLRGRPVGNFERIMLILGFLSYPVHEISRYIQFQPLFIIPLTVFIWAYWKIRNCRVSPEEGRSAG